MEIWSVLICVLVCSKRVLSVYDSEAVFTIKWFNSHESFLHSFFFEDEPNLQSRQKQEPRPSAGLEHALDEEQRGDRERAEREAALGRLESFEVRAKNSAKYKCYLPNEDDVDEREDTAYSGPSPVELLDEIFLVEPCSYLISSYWIYQLCHGKHFRQYHEEKYNKLQEYFLGVLDGFWQSHQFTEEHYAKRWPETLLRGLILEDSTHNYLEITMSEGTPCDIKGNTPRSVAVRYICVPGSRLELIDIREVATCMYEATVTAPSLCRHPDFAPVTKEETKLYCVAQEKNKLALLPTSSSHDFHIIMGDHVYREPFPGKYKPPTVRQSGERVETVEEDEDEDEDSDEEEKASSPIVTTVYRSDDGHSMGGQNVGLPPQFIDDDMPDDATTSRQLREFLDATECVKGGRGWWKHEFCYQQHIYHVHYETNPKTALKFVQKKIVLGLWDRDEHIEWAKKQLKGTYRSLEGVKPFVTLYYGRGDICHENNKFRHTLVKLRCLPSTKSQTSIAVSLLEPQLCSYVMTVDSGMFCDLLKHVDEFGIPIRGM